MKHDRPNRVVFVSGAGLSADSGIPVFRGTDQALWNNVSIEDVCLMDNFSKNYALVHDFYNEMRGKLREYEPNQGHRLMADFQSMYGGDRVKILTTNVDDLLERAGADDVLHLHGDLRYMRNLETGERFHVGYDPFECNAEYVDHKPDVIFFGEIAPAYDDLYQLLEGLYEGDWVIIVGTSNQVLPFAQLTRSHSSSVKITAIDIDTSHLGLIAAP